jgi:CelD/BcsL family acetyltransferase involved in cellulose biosynthesis
MLEAMELLQKNLRAEAMRVLWHVHAPHPREISSVPKLCKDLAVFSDKLSNEPTAEQVRGLTDELAALSKQQSKALQASAYKRMSVEEASEYDRRRVR